MRRWPSTVAALGLRSLVRIGAGLRRTTKASSSPMCGKEARPLQQVEGGDVWWSSTAEDREPLRLHLRAQSQAARRRRRSEGVARRHAIEVSGSTLAKRRDSGHEDVRSLMAAVRVLKAGCRRPGSVGIERLDLAEFLEEIPVAGDDTALYPFGIEVTEGVPIRSPTGFEGADPRCSADERGPWARWRAVPA